MLGQVYRPIASRGAVSLHQVLLAVGLLTSLAVLGESIARRERGLGAVLAAIVLTLTSVAALMSWPLIAWDQLALWAVTVGTDLRGLWKAGFSDEVRFVLVDQFEVRPSTYGRLVAVHLVVLPLVAAAALVGWWRTSRTDG